MEKFYEVCYHDDYMKAYNITENDFNISDFLADISRVNIQVDYIEVCEGVELDMQTINGRRYRGVGSFLKDLAEIYAIAPDASFDIAARYQNKALHIMVNESSMRLSTTTEIPDFEISDLLKEQTTRRKEKAVGEEELKKVEAENKGGREGKKQVEKKQEGPVSMELTKIVITGGPCAGKSTAMSWIQKAFTQMGYVVLFVPETATELITGGVAPWTCKRNAEFQKCLLTLQREKEKVFEMAASQMEAGKVLMVCDRGALDNKAYMSDAEFKEVLDDLRVSEVDLRDQYDAVFHLLTAAKGAEEFYTTANNAARTESVEEARKLDDALISAWTGHPHLRIIDNSTDFEDKMKRLIAEISAFLGEPEPFEIERKYLIAYPDLNWLNANPNCQKVEIIQTYLVAPKGEEVRIRQRGMDGHFIYVKTTKKKLTGLKRVEVEKRLTQEEYLALLMEADVTKKQIRKTRYCLTYQGQYFEIDVYPFWKDRAILEIELREEGQEIHFPKEIEIIKEVTEDEKYKNSSLASSGGKIELGRLLEAELKETNMN